MSVILKSRVLTQFFGSNEVSKEAIENKNKDDITIDITDGLTQDIVDDIKALARECPQVFRNITIKNKLMKPSDVQLTLDVIKNSSIDVKDFNQIEIDSCCKEDFSLDLSGFSKKISNLVLNNHSGSLASADIKGTPRRGIDNLQVHRFDLSSLDFETHKAIKELTIVGGDNRNFDQIRGASRLLGIIVDGLRNKLELSKIIDFAKTSPSLARIGFKKLDLSDMDIFEELSRSDVIEVEINDCQLSSLKGIDKKPYTELTIRNNSGVGTSEISRIENCFSQNPNLRMTIGNNAINDEFARIAHTFSPKTVENVRASYRGVIQQSEVMTYLLRDHNIPYSIRDAEAVRKLGIVKNPIELENDDDLDNIDFEQDYLRNGTLLLTVPQAERLLSSGKKIPMKLGIEIESAADLSVEKLDELRKGLGVSEVRVTGQDVYWQQRAPYSLPQYRRARRKLEEVVQGIDPNESDLDKFVTIYSRLAHMTYDYSAVGKDTREELSLANRLRYDASNMVNGLGNNYTCICAGFAEILRNACSLVGIRARYIGGDCYGDKYKSSGHAWTEVELDDGTGTKRKYWADLTFDNLKALRQGGREAYDFKYLLIDEETFRKDHKVIYSKGVTSDHREYDRRLVRDAVEKAKARDIYKRNAERLVPEPKPQPPQPQPEPKPAPQPQPGPKPGPGPQPQPGPKPGPQPNPQPDPKPQPKPGKVPDDMMDLLDEINKKIDDLGKEIERSMRRNPDRQGYPKPLPYRSRNEGKREDDDMER